MMIIYIDIDRYFRILTRIVFYRKNIPKDDKVFNCKLQMFFIPMIHSYPQAFHHDYLLGEKVITLKVRFFGNIGMCFLSHCFGQSLNDNSVLYGLKGNSQFSIKIFQYSTVLCFFFGRKGKGVRASHLKSKLLRFILFLRSYFFLSVS